MRDINVVPLAELMFRGEPKMTKRGGRRNGAGRPPEAIRALRRLVTEPTPGRAVLMDRARDGLARTVAIAAQVLPGITLLIAEKARQGDFDAQKFLVTTFTKFMTATEGEKERANPLANVMVNVQNVLNEEKLALDKADESRTVIVVGEGKRDTERDTVPPRQA